MGRVGSASHIQIFHLRTHVAGQELMFNSWTPYTAISHVWADGLGNAEANALPECQLRNLKAMVDALPLTVRRSRSGIVERMLAIRKRWFWLDTLCIPVQSIRSAPLGINTTSAIKLDSIKKMAIDSMSMIYVNAAPALVLDSEVQLLSLKADLAVLMAYINYCGWTTRGWTLQEGTLPETLVFALSDGFFDPQAQADIYRQNESQRIYKSSVSHGDHGRHLCNRHRTFDLRTLLFSSWSENRFPIWLSGQRTAWEDGLVQTVWNSLIRRHTSQKKDLPIILANLLGLRASVIIHDDRPVATIIGSLSHIPVGFLYNTGPRLQSLPRFATPHKISAQLATGTQSSDTGLQEEATFKLHAYDTVNRWVPTEIEGDSLPDGPYFKANASVLRLSKSDYSKGSTQDCDVFTTYSIRTIPPKMILRSAKHPNRPLIVNALYQTSDELALRELDNTLIGFCFLLEGKGNELRQKGTVAKGAALAIIGEAPSRLTTIFYCAIRVESTDFQAKASASFSDLQTVDANYVGPNVIEMLYSELFDLHSLI